jgi:hypothetical protein
MRVDSPPLGVIDDGNPLLKSPKSKRNTWEHASFGAVGQNQFHAPSSKGNRAEQQLEDSSKLVSGEGGLIPVGNDVDDGASNEQDGQLSEVGDMPIVRFPSSLSRYHPGFHWFSSSENPVLRTPQAFDTSRSILDRLSETLDPFPLIIMLHTMYVFVPHGLTQTHLIRHNREAGPGIQINITYFSFHSFFSFTRKVNLDTRCRGFHQVLSMAEECTLVLLLRHNHLNLLYSRQGQIRCMLMEMSLQALPRPREEGHSLLLTLIYAWVSFN